MELRRHAQGAPGHAYPRTSAWNSGVQDHFYKMLEYMFLETLQWNSGSTTHNQAQGAHINNKSAGANHSGTPHPEASWIIARESCEKFKVLTNPHGTPLLKITLARISYARFCSQFTLELLIHRTCLHRRTDSASQDHSC